MNFFNLRALRVPQSEIAATNFYDSGGSVGEELGDEFSAHFRASFAVQNDPRIFTQNSSQFITPCLVAEILKFILREFLGFGGGPQLLYFRGFF